MSEILTHDKHQRVTVLTFKGQPTFLVYKIASDEFIDETIRRYYGKQGDGEPHSWEAIDVHAVGT